MYLCAVFLDDDETPNTTVDCGDRFDNPHPSHSLCRGENIPFRLWVARGPDRHRTLLFAMSSPSTPVEISKESVDGGDFSQFPELASGDKLLALSDKAPWTERIGYNYHVFRQDLLWIHDGQGMNTPITRWNTDSTKLSATFFNVDSEEKVFRGLTLHRTPESTFRTACLYLNGQYNVLVEDVHVTTPKSKMIADGVFSVNNSAKITFRDMTVVVPAMVNTLNLYEPTGKLSELKKPVDYISSVMVEGLKIVRTNGKPAKINVRLSSREFITRQKMAFDIVHP